MVRSSPRMGPGQAQQQRWLVMNLWILQRRPSDLLEPYEWTRLREEARELNVNVEIVAPADIDLIVSGGGRRAIRRCGVEVDLPDAVLPRTGSFTDYFSLAILRQCEQLGVEVINSSQSIEAVKDKLFAHQILSQNKLPIPRTMLVRFPVDVDLVAQQIGFPCVVKLLVGSFGEGVLLSRDAADFRDLMELLASLDRSQAVILDIAGVDLLFDHDSYCVCEVNSAPGFSGFEAATGINVAREILGHALDRTRRPSRPFAVRQHRHSQQPLGCLAR